MLYGSKRPHSQAFSRHFHVCSLFRLLRADCALQMLHQRLLHAPDLHGRLLVYLLNFLSARHSIQMFFE